VIFEFELVPRAISSSHLLSGAVILSQNKAQIGAEQERRSCWWLDFPFDNRLIAEYRTLFGALIGALLDPLWSLVSSVLFPLL
jgi:hypothetical protein